MIISAKVNEMLDVHMRDYANRNNARLANFDAEIARLSNRLGICEDKNTKQINKFDLSEKTNETLLKSNLVLLESFAKRITCLESPPIVHPLETLASATDSSHGVYVSPKAVVNTFHAVDVSPEAVSGSTAGSSGLPSGINSVTKRKAKPNQCQPAAPTARTKPFVSLITVSFLQQLAGA